MANQSMKKSKILLASAAAGLMTLAMAAAPDQVRAGDDEEVKCYGVNKCKGSGECGGKGHGCAGKNACAGHGWIKLEKDKCLSIKGGRLTPEAAE